MNYGKYLSTLILALVISGALFAQPEAGLSKDGWVEQISGKAIAPAVKSAYLPAKPGLALYFLKAGNLDAPYIVCVPATYGPAKPSKLVVFLHGAILARNDFQYKEPSIANEPIFSVSDTYNTIVVFPFGKSDFMWPADEAANQHVAETVTDAARHYNIDKQRIYLGGISMGGMATFWFITHNSGLFAGFYTFSAMPRLTSGAISFGNITKNKPLYSMHAKDDAGFSFSEVKAIYDQYKEEAPGWHLSSVETGGHRFIYNAIGRQYVKALLGNLLGK
jgi:predicted peptidase